MAQLNVLKEHLEDARTRLAIEQNKLTEAVATLKDEYGIGIEEAAGEYEAITKGQIPQLILKRDNMLKKAQAIMEGIDNGEDTQTSDGQGGAAAGANAGGSARQNDQGGRARGRQIVGRRRAD
jgi:hypothetical protein